jgi:hypothetical protein
VAENGTGFVRSGGSLAWRMFNPGNLRASHMACAMFCEKKSDGTDDCFAAFDSYESGRNAKEFLLRNAYSRKNISDAIHIYAPKEDNNNPNSYSNRVKKAIRNNVKTPEYWDEIVNGGKRINTITVGELLKDDTTKKYLLDGIQEVEVYCGKGSYLPGMVCFQNHEYPTAEKARASRKRANIGKDMICPVEDRKACTEHVLPK